jgi:hypothetical protein
MRTTGFRKRGEISWLAERLLISLEELGSLKLIWNWGKPWLNLKVIFSFACEIWTENRQNTQKWKIISQFLPIVTSKSQYLLPSQINKMCKMFLFTQWRQWGIRISLELLAFLNSVLGRGKLSGTSLSRSWQFFQLRCCFDLYRLNQLAWPPNYF